SDRRDRVPAARLPAADGAVLAVLCPVLRGQRMVRQRWWPAPLADQVRPAFRLRPARRARSVGNHQAHRRPERLRDDRREIREADAVITLDAMPPLMFGGLVLFMLVGYPVAFSLAALGIAFGFVAIDHGFFTISYLQAIP